ncbi:F-box protein CPR30-like [Chenopodium quinoa]|uniref:F-box protein CPR30-like n=1 Tax=Chenopodium quinoa TaxID=63459 RepID=UPI000B781236|nr:F-box protein CPR30-like [Chenopodium quinoa]
MAELSSMEREFSRDDNLPEELLLEILAWLPSKTLLKFRSVCKTWCSFIDSSNFIPLHLKRYNYNSQKVTHHLIAIERSVGDGCNFTIRCCDTFNKIADLVEFPEPHSISGNRNGLILLINGRNSVRLWNPSIRKSLFLPHCPFASPWGRSRRCCVAYALGFSPSSNDHKVLAIKTIIRRFNDDAWIAVYSLTDHLWRKKQNPVSKSGWAISGFRREGGLVCCGGVVYWIDRNRQANGKLYLYDFDVEEFSVMQLPDAVKESTNRFIFAHGESLGVLLMSSESSCIWVLEKDGGENPWRLWFKGDPNLDAPKVFDCSSIVYGQKSNTFLLFNTHNHITMSYNIASNQTRTMMSSRIFFQTYLESLVLHKDFDETITSFL